MSNIWGGDDVARRVATIVGVSEPGNYVRIASEGTGGVLVGPLVPQLKTQLQVRGYLTADWSDPFAIVGKSWESIDIEPPKPLQAVFSAITGELLIDDPRVSNQALSISPRGVETRPGMPVELLEGTPPTIRPSAVQLDPVEARQVLAAARDVAQTTNAGSEIAAILNAGAGSVRVDATSSAGVAAQLLEKIGGARTAWIVAAVVVVLFLLTRRKG